MSTYLIGLTLVLTTFVAQAQESDSPDLSDCLAGGPVPEAVADFNAQVTDADVFAYIRELLKGDPERLAEVDANTVEQRNMVQTMRADSRCLKLPRLADLSPKEADELAVMSEVLGNRSAKARWALDAMTRHDATDFRQFIDGCITLLAQQPKGKRLMRRIHHNLPKALVERGVEMVDLSPKSCSIFLQKGMGAGIGYGVSLVPDGRHVLTSFNHYRSWESTQMFVLEP